MAIHGPSVEDWDPDVLKAAKEIDSKFPRPREWTSTYPYHGEGSSKGAYAIDFMVSDRELGDQIANYAWNQRDRLGIRYVIWWGRIISETHPTQPDVWLRYFNADNPDPSKSHKNHVHVSHYANNNWVYKALVRRWSQLKVVRTIGYNLGWGSHVRVVQICLRELKYNPGPIDRVKGEQTISALNRFLEENGWPKASGKMLNLAQLSLLLKKAEAVEAGDNYPPAST